jgi:hypothetical protein
MFIQLSPWQVKAYTDKSTHGGHFFVIWKELGFNSLQHPQNMQSIWNVIFPKYYSFCFYWFFIDAFLWKTRTKLFKVSQLNGFFDQRYIIPDMKFLHVFNKHLGLHCFLKFKNSCYMIPLVHQKQIKLFEISIAALDIHHIGQTLPR